MRIRYIPADPAGNRTGLVLTPVPQEMRGPVSARLMQVCPEGFDQIGYVGADTPEGLPRLDMMGGEFCGNACRAFGLYAAGLRGDSPREIRISVSGAREPVPVRLVPERNEAYARMPLPEKTEWISTGGEHFPVVRMEGIAHCILEDRVPDAAAAQAVLAAMPEEDAQGVIFAEGDRMTPYVYVRASGTGVWEGSCGSGSTALACVRCAGKPDGETRMTFLQPAGSLTVTVRTENGKPVFIEMGGSVTLGEAREIEI